MESITKAQQTAGLLKSDVLEAHKQACAEDPVLEIVLFDLLKQVNGVVERIAYIENALEAKGK